MVGVFWGSPLFGWLSDNYGRKLTLCICFCLSFFSMVAVRFVSGSYTFLILCFLRMLDGAGAIGGIAAAFVLISEVFESKVRFFHGFFIPNFISRGTPKFWFFKSVNPYSVSDRLRLPVSLL